MNYYLLLVLIVAIICFSVAYFIPVIMIRINRDLDSETENCLAGWCWALFILFLFSPLVYEFKPISPKVNQCKIIRDETGAVIGLKKEATGFHRLFYHEYSFVSLSKTFEQQLKVTLPSDGCLVHIPFKVVCSDPMLTYVASNGKIYNQDFPYDDLPNDYFTTWVDSSFRSVIVIDEQLIKSMKPREVYSWFVEKAKVWSETNNVSCHIEVESFDKVDTNFYTTK